MGRLRRGEKLEAACPWLNIEYWGEQDCTHALICALSRPSVPWPHPMAEEGGAVRPVESLEAPAQQRCKASCRMSAVLCAASWSNSGGNPASEFAGSRLGSSFAELAELSRLRQSRRQLARQPRKLFATSVQ
eukprot:scaffold2329_cov247-Pinguiococcus_pyrenoidosus.AAC.16